MQLRRVAQLAALSDFAAQVSSRAAQGLAGFLALVVASEAGEEDPRRLQVRRHLDVGHRHTVEVWVVRLEEEQARQLRPHDVGDIIEAFQIEKVAGVMA